MESDIKIFTCPPERWQQYKELRLEALKNEPQAFAETYEKVEGIDGEEWTRRLSLDDRVNIRMVAENKDGRLVGMMTAVRSKDNKNNALIINVYINKDYRGAGLGKKMLKEILNLLEKVDDIKIIELTVNVAQGAAVSIYKTCGFEITETLKDSIVYEGKSFDEYVMIKNN
jgi:ribosomal protein S18 acetylase RimI-like enzyme